MEGVASLIRMLSCRVKAELTLVDKDEGAN